MCYVRDIHLFEVTSNLFLKFDDLLRKQGLFGFPWPVWVSGEGHVGRFIFCFHAGAMPQNHARIFSKKDEQMELEYKTIMIYVTLWSILVLCITVCNKNVCKPFMRWFILFVTARHREAYREIQIRISCEKLHTSLKVSIRYPHGRGFGEKSSRCFEKTVTRE